VISRRAMRRPAGQSNWAGRRAPAAPTGKGRLNSGPKTIQISSLRIAQFLAILGLIASSGLLYHVAFSPLYRLDDIRVSGNILLSRREADTVIDSQGSDAFWLRTKATREQLMEIPSVADADVQVRLPNRVEVRVHERTPHGVWQSGTVSVLVDSGGLVIGATSEAPPILTIRDLDAPRATTEKRFDPESFDAVKTLTGHLGGTAFEPASFAYSQQSGLEFETREGIVVRLGDGKELDWKLGALDTMRQYLVENRLRAQLIDVRFRDRPYFR
jgi:cell division protein FtsQ